LGIACAAFTLAFAGKNHRDSSTAPAKWAIATGNTYLTEPKRQTAYVAHSNPPTWTPYDVGMIWEPATKLSSNQMVVPGINQIKLIAARCGCLNIKAGALSHAERLHTQKMFVQLPEETCAQSCKPVASKQKIASNLSR
jgi:hypothetical protein